MVSATDPYGHILRFLDQSRYFFFQVALQLYSRGCVDPKHIPATTNMCKAIEDLLNAACVVCAISDTQYVVQAK
jgi:hypothetical protein